MSKSERFKYLGSIIHKDENIEDDVYYRIRVWWLKWRSVSKVLCNLTIFIRIAIRPTVFYDIECWSLKICAIRMRMIYCIVENKQKNIVQNIKIHLKMRVPLIDEKVLVSGLRWFSYV